MKRAFAFNLVSAVLSGCAATAPPPPDHTSQSNIPFEPAVGHFDRDCNAPVGKYQKFDFLLPSKKVRITGNIQFLGTREDGRFAGAASVYLSGAEDGQTPAIGLQTYVMPDSPYMVRLELHSGGSLKPRSEFASLPLTSTPFAFSLTLDDTGRLVVSAEHSVSTRRIDLKGLTRIVLSCSAAHVSFTDVAIVDRAQ